MFPKIAMVLIVFSATLGWMNCTLFQTYQLKMNVQSRLSGYDQTVARASKILNVSDDEARTFHDILASRRQSTKWLPPRLEAATILGVPWSTPQEEIVQKAFVVQQALDNEIVTDPRFGSHHDDGMTFKIFKKVPGFMKPDEISYITP